MTASHEQLLLADCLRARATATAADLALQVARTRVARTARILADDALARVRQHAERPVETEYLAALEAELEAEHDHRSAARAAAAAELDYRNYARQARRTAVDQVVEGVLRELGRT